MKTIYSKKYSLHNSLTELSGGKLVKPFETSERVKFILNEISNRKLGPILEATEEDFNSPKKKRRGAGKKKKKESKIK